MEWEMLKESRSNQEIFGESSYFNASYPRETTYPIHFSNRVYLGTLLAQLYEHGKERAIYYISHTLVSYEVNYTSIEKACLTIVFASQKLWHYMLVHIIHLIAKIDPLKYLLGKATLTGGLAKSMMILLEFDIEYVECKEIKGQAIEN